MAELIFKIIEIVVMIAVLFYVREIAPHVQQDEWQSIFAEMKEWALIAVRWAQDRLGTEPGYDRRKAAVNALKQIRDKLGLQEILSDDQIYMLISDAYLVMKDEDLTTGTESPIGFTQEDDNAAVSD